MAYVNAKSTEGGVSFPWEGVWEFDQRPGTGSAALECSGRLEGEFKNHGR